MGDITIRSDNVDVEQIMQQIRTRIREKRGVDYTEDEIRELASVKLERFLDPSKVRSGLLEQFRKARELAPPPELYDFGEDALYASHRLPLLVKVRRFLNPLLRLFINPNALIRVLHLQTRLNQRYAAKEHLDYEVMSNLVLEITKLSIEVKNLKMRIESISARLDFDEQRARALEGVVQYRPGALSPVDTGESEGEGSEDEGEAERTPRAGRRRRRRRGRRRLSLSPPAGQAGAPGGAADSDTGETEEERTADARPSTPGAVRDDRGDAPAVPAPPSGTTVESTES